ncbi:hypothetical protein ACFGVS_22610 [Mucilaginibacter sp. AW1-7]|uniref:hypothetical protein n=1 Tax=unclassified Mucilaginibacter TaxID=2617802 RepID=UPI0008D7B18A|nr:MULTISPECIES: hypothetical protein [unclassified Mucilaginibacter]WDF78328.1 hypothetical protein PQ469_31050 [Mucilaginibacter sp. KACC 22773]SEP35647.1 hypothetical protein SAMN05428947_11256 [Mucilaginibacter sp. OK283]
MVYLKHILIITLTFIGSVTCAQIRFKIGDEFQRQVITKSNCVLQRGGQTLRVGSISNIVKTYKVIDATEKNASVTIITDKLIDTVNAMDQNLVYNSARPGDPNSIIHAGLQKMVNTRPMVTVNHKGEVLNLKRPVSVDDTLLSFTGIQPERLLPGSTLQFMVDFPVNPALKKGYTWTDATKAAETSYTIYAVSGRTTTITYKTSVLGGNLNSRINGSILIDNLTGIILKRYSQSVSTGYEMVNGVVYTATRRTAITEVSVKK